MIGTMAEQHMPDGQRAQRSGPPSKDKALGASRAWLKGSVDRTIWSRVHSKTKDSHQVYTEPTLWASLAKMYHVQSGQHEMNHCSFIQNHFGSTWNKN